MAISHAEKRLYGVQFHPESILTQQGLELLNNFLRLA
jgi:para-aminobenzoate synthetase component 2